MNTKRHVTDCSEVQAELDAYARGELSPASSADVERHLANCADCSDARDSLAAMSTRLTGLRSAFEATSPALTVVTPGRTHRRYSAPTRFLVAVAAAWTVIATVGVLWPGFVERVSFLPTGRSLKAEQDESARLRGRTGQMEAQLREAERALAVSTFTGLPAGGQRALLQLLSATGPTGRQPLRSLSEVMAGLDTSRGMAVELVSLRAVDRSGSRVTLSLGFRVIADGRSPGSLTELVVRLRETGGGWHARIMAGVWPPAD